MHGADNDLCIIKSVFNLSIVNFIDTSRVDAELRKNKGGGVRGLATLANEYLHIEMNKDYQVS